MSEVLQPIIIVRKKKHGGGGHHGGAWKVAYADFVTAMMAFFMVMWLVATMPQEQLGGIAEYFKNPSAVPGSATTMSPGANGPGGAGNVPIKMFDHLRNPPGAGPDAARATERDDAAQKARDALDRERLEALQRALEKAISSSQALAPFKDQLLIDITPEGLRIQIVDTYNRPMFDLGSPNLKDYTTKILLELATYLNQVENRIAISGHTDNTPYSDRSGFGNWELSAQRANAARRALVAGGLEEMKLSRVVGLSSSVPFDKTDERNPINRRISIVVLNNAAERSAAEVNDAIPADAPGAPETPAAAATPGAADDSNLADSPEPAEPAVAAGANAD